MRQTQYVVREHVCQYETGPHKIYDVYAGDSARDYAAADYRPMRKIESFRTRREADQYMHNRTMTAT